MAPRPSAEVAVDEPLPLVPLGTLPQRLFLRALCRPDVPRRSRPIGSGRSEVSRYDIRYVEIYASARKHGIADDDIMHAVENALAIGEHDDGKVLYLGPDRAANLLEVISVTREEGSEIVIHAMRMRAKYEPFLRGEGDSDD